MSYIHIRRYRRRQLCELMAALESRYQLVPSSMVVSTSCNIFAMGGPKEFSFVGQDGTTIFVGECSYLANLKWLIFRKITWSFFRLCIVKTDGNLAVFQALDWPNPPRGPEILPNRNIIDAGEQGLFLLSNAKWESLAPIEGYISKSGERRLFVRDIEKFVHINMKRGRISIPETKL